MIHKYRYICSSCPCWCGVLWCYISARRLDHVSRWDLLVTLVIWPRSMYGAAHYWSVKNLPTVFNVPKIRLTLHNYATIQHFNISNILKTQSIIRLGIYSPGLQSCLGSNIQYREFNIQYFQSIKFHISYPLLSYFCF